MPAKVVCTICSRDKAKNKEPLPARDRYIGSHIKSVADIAKRKGAPLFFLSGVYGFISEKEQIPYYDHLLGAEEIESLVENKLRPQLLRYKVKEVQFYFKNKPAWKPYLAAIQHTAMGLGITLVVYELDA